MWAGLDDSRHGTIRLLELLEHDVRKSAARDRILRADVLVIDEISMISARIFSTLEEVCRKLRKVENAFGGLQLIVVGDFLQLQPVKNLPYGDAGLPPFKSPAWDAIRHTVGLQQVQRQVELEFIKCIHDVSRGELPQDTEHFIRSLERPHQKGHHHTVHLFARNVEVTKFNNEQLIKNGGYQKKYSALDDGHFRYLDSMQAPRLLAIRRGCPVMLLINMIEKNPLLVNGSLGYVADFNEEDIIVNFIDAAEYITLERYQFTDFDPRIGQNRATRLQFPLKLAYGMTIHKAQGMSLQSVVVDCSLIDMPGMLGVAIGRCITSAGLEIQHFSRRCVVKQADEIIAACTENHPKEQDSCCMHIKPPAPDLDDPLTIQAQENISDTEDDVLMQYVEEIEDSFQDLESDPQGTKQTSQPPEDLVTQRVQDSHDMRTLPDKFSIDDMIEYLKFEKILSEKQQTINNIMDDLKENSNFRVFCEALFNSLISLHSQHIKAFPASSSQVTAYAKSLATMVLSPAHHERLKNFFGADPNPDQIDVMWHITYHVSSLVETVRQEEAGLTFSNKYQSVRKDMSAAVQSKLRYIAGYVIGRVQFELLRKMKIQAESFDQKVLREYESNHDRVMAVRSLIRSQSEIEQQTTLPDTIKEITDRQTASFGLTNISDDVFNFFTELCKLTINHMTGQAMSTYNENVHEMLVNVLQIDQNLQTMFQKLFDEEHSGVLPQLLNDIVCKFSRVLLRQWRKDIQSVTVEKKAQHRKEIQMIKSRLSNDAAKVTDPPAEKQDEAEMFACSLKSISDQKLLKLKKVDLQIICRSFSVSDCGTKAAMLKSLRLCDTMPDIEQIKSSLSKEGLKLLNITSQETSSLSTPQQESDSICKKCQQPYKEDEEWIMCDSCKGWMHRLCAGINSEEVWDMISQEDEDFICCN